MTFRSKAETWKQILRNAGVLGGISAVCNLMVTADLSFQNLYSGFLVGIAVFLIELKHNFKINSGLKRNVYSQKTFFLP